MRKIKFRALDKEENKFHYFGLFELDEAFHITDMLTVDEMPIMQFTGLHDRNGEEIWEGDFVKENNGIVWRVLWFEEGAGFVFQNIKNTDDVWCPNSESTSRGFEVIGNIYENPKLLGHNLDGTPEK